MEKLLIKVVNDEPQGDPLTWDNVKEIHPNLTEANYKKLGYGKFTRKPKPVDTPTHTYESAGYSMDGYGDVVETYTAVERETPDAVMAAGLVRQRRNALLAQTDWAVTKASETGVAISTEMATFREALRDITTHSNFPFLEEADWPEQP